MKKPTWKMVHLHCPKWKYEIKKHQYRVVLVIGGVALYCVHRFLPDYEIHAVLILHGLVTFDPTV